VAVAAHLKATTPTGNRRLAERLHLGTPVAMSHLVGPLRRRRNPAAALLLAELTVILNSET
jgi:hypothetical protein